MACWTANWRAWPHQLSDGTIITDIDTEYFLVRFS
jgi:hypothetical protein